MKQLCTVLCSVFLIFASSLSFAQSMTSLPSFDNSDRVLILAPHPDDETIGAAGVIQEAVKAGARVKVVLLTNGENNELAFIVYKKRPILGRSGLLRMGELRRQESLAAMKFLGLKESDVISLGYPDFGTMEIMTRYWDEKRPVHGMLSRVSRVPYPDAMSPGAPYVGQSVLHDLEQVILDYRPTKIFVSHPADVNRDHRALYLFTQVAYGILRERSMRRWFIPISYMSRDGLALVDIILTKT